MMRLTAVIIYCWIACLLASCAGGASSDAIEVNLLHTDVDTIAYSAFVDSIEYIPLETTEECLVGEVTDVVMADDRLFVFDAKQQEVWSFDRSGRYVGRLGRRGEGPGEYLSIAQFEYDHRDSLLAVLTFVEAPCVQYYSPDGTYVKTVKLGMPADDFKLGADGSFILSCAGRDDPSAGIYHADASGGAVRPLVTRTRRPSPCRICRTTSVPITWKGSVGFTLRIGRRTGTEACAYSYTPRRMGGIGWPVV